MLCGQYMFKLKQIHSRQNQSFQFNEAAFKNHNSNNNNKKKNYKHRCDF